MRTKCIFKPIIYNCIKFEEKKINFLKTITYIINKHNQIKKYDHIK